MSTKTTGPAKALTSRASPQARRLAAAILEALAGLRGPAEAAQAAGLSLQRYYAAEARALRGLLEGCEPAAPGRQPSDSAELQTLRAQKQRLEMQCARQQALLRLQQRTLGLSPSAAVAPAGKGKKPGKKRRRPRTRALRLIEQLRQEAAEGSNGEPGPSEG